MPASQDISQHRSIIIDWRFLANACREGPSTLNFSPASNSSHTEAGVREIFSSFTSTNCSKWSFSQRGLSERRQIAHRKRVTVEKDQDVVIRP